MLHTQQHPTAGNAFSGCFTSFDMTTAVRHSPVFQHLTDRLQSVINAAAWLIFSSRKYNHVTPLLHELHWLRMRQRIEYKLAVLVYRCLHGLAPPYLASDLQRVEDRDDRRHLRSSLTDALNVPSTRLSTVGNCAFSVAAARVWNSLPATVTSSPTHHRC